VSADSWIFGYGSLLWRPDFAFADRAVAVIEGWSRRFWQGSTDHRGVPEAPGRVVTLEAAPASCCWGLVYRVAGAAAESVLAGLDHRERGGFDRIDVDARLGGDARAVVRAITYVAAPGNPNYLGPAPLPEIAAQVRMSHGPSGSNLEYALRLAEILRELDLADDHVFELAELLVSSD
jgi:cation transport regulator ChaC